MKRSHISALAPLILLQACMTAPSTPSAFHPLNLPATLGMQAAVWPDETWWRSFESPELEAIVSEAISANPDIEIAASRIDQAQAQLRISAASLVPTVTTDISGTRLQGTNNVQTVSRSYFQPTLSASYELDLWGRTRSSARSARASLAASRYDQDAQRLSITAEAADLYIQILGLRDRGQIARLNLQAAKQILIQTEVRAKHGAALQRDVDTQHALVADRAAAIPDLDRAEVDARTALAILLGRPPQEFKLAATGMSDLRSPAPASPGLTADLLTRRPDVAAAYARLIAAGEDVASARAAMLPRITLTASGGGQWGTGPSSALYELIAGLTHPLFDNGTSAGRRDYAVGIQRERSGEYRRAILNALAEVEKALIAIRTSEDALAARETGVGAAQRAEAQTSARFHAGAEDMITAVNAQTNLYDARDTLLTARVLRLRAVVALYRVLGGGWSPQENGDSPP